VDEGEPPLDVSLALTTEPDPEVLLEVLRLSEQVVYSAQEAAAWAHDLASMLEQTDQ
jgi:hypothetical protein